MKAKKQGGKGMTGQIHAGPKGMPEGEMKQHAGKKMRGGS